MTTVIPMPVEVFLAAKDSGVDLSQCLDIEYLIENFSVSDLHSISECVSNFSFKLPVELEVNLTDAPVSLLTQKPEYDELYKRVDAYRQSAMLTTVPKPKAYCYKLHVVSDTVWIAVCSPYLGLGLTSVYTANRKFFDDMIERLSAEYPLDRIAKTDLFSYYLGAL